MEVKVKEIKYNMEKNTQFNNFYEKLDEEISVLERKILYSLWIEGTLLLSGLLSSFLTESIWPAIAIILWFIIHLFTMHFYVIPKTEKLGKLQGGLEIMTMIVLDFAERRAEQENKE